MPREWPKKWQKDKKKKKKKKRYSCPSVILNLGSALPNIRSFKKKSDAGVVGEASHGLGVWD